MTHRCNPNSIVVIHDEVNGEVLLEEFQTRFSDMLQKVCRMASSAGELRGGA